MRFNIVLFFLVLVFVSGCNAVSGGSNEGIRITQFGFDSSAISDKDSVELSLTLDNVGSYDSDSVNFYLYGYDSDSWESSNAGASVGSASEDSWTIDSFEGYDADVNFAGMSGDYYQTFKLASDKLARGVRNSYNFNGRLCYKYQTSATAMIEAISSSQRRAEGGSSTGTVKVDNSYGPIQVQVKSKSPLVFYDDSDTIDTELALIIKNVGSGFAASDGCSLDVSVDTINMISGIEVTLDGESLTCDDDYSLYGGQAVVFCEYGVSGSRPKGEYMLNVVVDYYYYDDVKASISVTGTSDDVEISSPSGGTGTSGSTAKLTSCEDACGGLGMCVDSDQKLATYPGTSTDVMLKDLNYAVSGPFYLADQNLHDVTVADAGINKLDGNKLSTPDYTKQFSESSLKQNDDDGNPISTNLGLNGGSNFMVTTSANPTEHEMKSDELVDGMKIVGIGDESIADMTKDSDNTKVQNIKSLDVEKMDLNKLGVVSSDIANKVKCKSSTTYTDDTVCKCVDKSEDQYPAFDGTSNSDCNSRCKDLSSDYAGGVCTKDSSYTSKSGTRCKGSSLVQYSMHASDTDEACDGDYCWCYKVIKSLSSSDKDLVCE